MPISATAESAVEHGCPDSQAVYGVGQSRSVERKSARNQLVLRPFRDRVFSANRRAPASFGEGLADIDRAVQISSGPDHTG